MKKLGNALSLKENLSQNEESDRYAEEGKRKRKKRPSNAKANKQASDSEQQIK